MIVTNATPKSISIDEFKEATNDDGQLAEVKRMIQGLKHEGCGNI